MLRKTEMGSDECEAISGGIIFILGSVCMVIISGVVLADISTTEGYEKKFCNAQNAQLETGVKLGHHWGVLSNVQVYTRAQNGTLMFERVINNMFFPPIKNYLLLKKRSEGDIDDWAAGKTGSATFSCRVDPDSDDAVSTIEDNAGWITMMFFGCLFCLLIICCVLYILCDGFRCRNCCFCFQKRSSQSCEQKGTAIV